MIIVIAGCGKDEPPRASVSDAPSPAASHIPTRGPETPRTTPAPVFRGEVKKLDASLRRSMNGSTWEPGCPVGLDDLRLLEVSHWDDNGGKAEGRIVVHRAEAADVVDVFRALFDARYPVTKMRLMDAYDGDDDASMVDNNTSGFNCRKVKGSSNWSQHSYGRAVDVNPFKNPWVNRGTVDPPQAARYADRSIDDPQIIRRGDRVWQAFADIGWTWGGDWASSKDYQHFSADGR